MGSMNEEMKKVMDKWKNEEAAQEEDAQEHPTYRAEILEYIRKHPGATGVQIRDVMCAKYPQQTEAAVSSQISCLHRLFHLRREPSPIPGKRHTFTYFAIEPEEAKRMQKRALAQRKAAQARLEKARQVKAEKDRARKLAAQSADKQMELPLDKVVAPGGPFVIAPTPIPTITPAPAGTLDLRSYTAVDILNAVNFKQAKELYAELKGAFGG